MLLSINLNLEAPALKNNNVGEADSGNGRNNDGAMSFVEITNENFLTLESEKEIEIPEITQPELSTSQKELNNVNTVSIESFDFNTDSAQTTDSQSGIYPTDDLLDEGQQIVDPMVESGSPGANYRPKYQNSDLDTEDITSAPEKTPQPVANSNLKTLRLGTDNPEKAGHTTGYTYQKNSSTYISIGSYYAYPYYYKPTSGSTMDYHSWVVFDLQDLSAWQNVSVKSLRLIIHNQQMYTFDKVNFTLLNTTPYNDAPYSIGQAVFNESGSSGIQIGQYQLKTTSNTTHGSFGVALNNIAVNSVNDKINSSKKYTLSIGMYILSLQSGFSYGFSRWYDFRLEVTFEGNDLPARTKEGETVVIGDDLTGYVQNSTLAYNYPLGFSSVFDSGTSEQRGYFYWKIPKIRKLFKNSNLTSIYFTKVSLRFNHNTQEFNQMYFYQMDTNVTSGKASDIFDDCGSGRRYLGPISQFYQSITEYEFNLGSFAVLDFQSVFDNNSANSFFAIGLMTRGYSYSYDYGPRLVIEWSDSVPVHNIDKDLYYPYIELAVDQADPYDTIEVKNGTLHENVKINKPINLVGESKETTIIDGSGFGDTFLINGNNVNISGFTIIGSGLLADDAGIEIENARNCSIVNNIITDHVNGILLDSSLNITIENNTLNSCGIFLKGERLEHWNTHEIDENNTVNGKSIIYRTNVVGGEVSINAGQVIIANCSNITIQSQNLKRAGTGLIVGYSNYNLITNNTSELNSNQGIYLKYSEFNRVMNNVFINNDRFGIGLYNSSNNFITENNCSFNTNGIYLISSSNSFIANNICNNNENGVFIKTSFNNTVKDNTCSDNLNSGVQNVVQLKFGIRKIPVDVVLMLDTSGSMFGKKIQDLKMAATNFVNHELINEQDRIAIYTFSTGTAPLQPFIKCNSTGKSVLTSKINNLTASGGTPLWDTIGYAINYSKIYGSNRIPIVIAMTDGADSGSLYYSPWHNLSSGKKQYHNLDGTEGHDYLRHYGNLPESESQWSWLGLYGSYEWRYGLLNSENVTLFTVGLGITHVNHSGDSNWRFPDGWYGAYAQHESVVNNWNVNYNSSKYGEFGTPEFNLWRIANSSGGDYFYANIPGKLNPIFQKLVEIITAPGIDVNSTFTGNLLQNNKHGIYLKKSNAINISNNNCSGNEFGVKLEASSENLITNNLFMNNSNGLYLVNSLNNTIFHNNFISNDLHSFDNINNRWNASYPVGGNYWDTWTTPDHDDDGFVDLPYNVSGGTSRDYLPFARKSGWGNNPPTTPVVDVTPDTPITIDSIICNITIPSVDKDGDTILYIYDWYLNRGSGFELQEALTVVTQELFSTIPANLTLKGNIWRCVVTPFDGNENGTAAVDEVMVLNSPPTAPAVEILSKLPYTNDDLVCTVTTPAADLDDDEITYTYEWYRDNGSGFTLQEALTSETTNQSVTLLNILTIRDEVWRCVVTPNDGEVDGESASDQVLILNSPPGAPEVQMTPAEPYTDDDLVCTVISQATDLDQDTIIYTYEWYRDSGTGYLLIPELTEVTTELSVSIGPSNTTKHEHWQCIVTPSDGTVNGTPDDAQTTIKNSSPTAIIDSPTNGTSIEISNHLYFDASGSSDPDEELLIYDWDFDYDDDTFDADASGKNVSKKWDYYFNGTVALRVKDNDGEFDIDVVNIRITNVPPIAELEVQPMVVDISIRIAGEKWHDVVVELYDDDDTLAANGSLTRYPGSPNDQMLNLTNVKLGISNQYSLLIRYTPADDPVNGRINGATPCWVIINYDTNSQVRLHHTFNVKQPDTYTWKVNVTKELHFNNITFKASVFDVGPDEITVNIDFGDGNNTSKFHPNPTMNYPVSFTEMFTHNYSIAGVYTVTLTVKDNHGGITTVKTSISVG
jgi:parallel beta-helix repeat protein